MTNPRDNVESERRDRPKFTALGLVGALCVGGGAAQTPPKPRDRTTLEVSQPELFTYFKDVKPLVTALESKEKPRPVNSRLRRRRPYR